MPATFEGVPVDLSKVENTIRTVERDTSWSIPLPGRTVIHQLFVSLALDQGGFAIEMPPNTRQQALQTAQNELDGFLRHVIEKSKKLKTGSGYQGTEVGFPVVVHELDGWATRITCSCWPR
jgi:hypothetical protein